MTDTSFNFHSWERGVKNKMPILKCRECPVIWWPDRNEPQSECKGTN